MQGLNVVPVGEAWQSSIIWGKSAGNGQSVEQISPLDGSVVQRTSLLDQSELNALLNSSFSYEKPSIDELRLFCNRLHDELTLLYDSLLEATRIETCFNPQDTEEVVQACIEYVKGFPDYFAGLSPQEPTPLSYSDASVLRQIRQIDVPWGTVAVILPQSAFLYLALTCMLNALATGNRIILRSPVQSARSAAILGLALQKTELQAERISIAMISARTFVAAICESKEPILVHYLGGSSHAPDLMSRCFQAGKAVIIDGEGNAWVWVDEDVSIDHACDILTSGATRYNGQTCTSINGAMVHPKIYESVKDKLTERWNQIGDKVGPLLDEAQAEYCLGRVNDSSATILAGGERNGSYLAPTLASEPKEDSDLVTKGLFGPALWIAPGDCDRFTSLWKRNCYPLCTGVLSGNADFGRYIQKLPNLARLVVNGDPSIEYMYEPWGGYPSTGTNPVSHWFKKYLRTVQVDSPD